jgi:DNA-binding FrmR family transcriptional regulator
LELKRLQKKRLTSPALWYKMIADTIPPRVAHRRIRTTDTQNDVTIRLKKIEGQVRGIRRMIEENSPCVDVLRQVRAARKAFDKVGFVILAGKMKECVTAKGDSAETDAAMEDYMELFLTLT